MEFKSEETYTDKESLSEDVGSESGITTGESFIVPEESPMAVEETTKVVNETPLAVNDPPVVVKETPTVMKESPNRIYIDGERWFTYKQLASILHCTPQSVYNYVRSGKVKTKKIDGVSFYRLDEYM